MHKYHLLGHEMIHFLSIFFNYIMVEVIESSWSNFIDGLITATSLDDLINLHYKFI